MTVEASVRPEAFWSSMQGDGVERRHLPIAEFTAKFHPFGLGGATGHRQCMRQPLYVGNRAEAECPPLGGYLPSGLTPQNPNMLAEEQHCEDENAK